MNIEEIKKEIDQVGHVSVIFEPSSYNSTLIHKGLLLEVLEKSAVSLRGWDFPHIPREDSAYCRRPYSIGNGLEFYTSWNNIQKEIFRLYQSGQFLAKFILYEDTIEKVHGNILEPGKYLDFLSLIYRSTEIILFIKNLMVNSNIDNGKIIITINRTQDRELDSIFSDRIPSFYSSYICRINQIVVSRSFSREEIVDNFLDIARELIGDIFNDFNWTNYSGDMIRNHQENLINRTI